LSRSLRELESDNVISKKILSQKPLNIEYEFTEFGMTIIPVLEVLAQWGRKMLKASIMFKSDSQSRIDLPISSF